MQSETDFDVDDLGTFVKISLPELIPEQCIVYTTVMEVIKNQRSGLYFLDDSGGTDKTFLISLILAIYNNYI